LQASVVQVSDVAREALDLGQIVRGDQNRGLLGALDQSFDQLSWTRGSGSERLVEHQQPGPVGQDETRAAFMHFTR
jgi:hypothetical protein